MTRQPASRDSSGTCSRTSPHDETMQTLRQAYSGRHRDSWSRISAAVPTERVPSTRGRRLRHPSDPEPRGARRDDGIGSIRRRGLGRRAAATVSTFVMELELELPEDPYTKEYRERVFELFRFVRGETYDSTNERTPIDLDACVLPRSRTRRRAPKPWKPADGDRSPDQDDGLPPVESGTRARLWLGKRRSRLAQMGHAVTAIDIDPSMASSSASEPDGWGSHRRSHGRLLPARRPRTTVRRRAVRRELPSFLRSPGSVGQAWIGSCPREASSSSPRSRSRMRCRPLVPAARRRIAVADQATRLARARVPGAVLRKHSSVRLG